MRTLLRLAAVALLLTLGFGVAPATAGGGGCHEPAKKEGTGATVDIEDFCMSPTALHVEAGETVSFVNHDGAAHNVYGLNWGDNHLGTGESFEMRFDEEGVHPYACTLHPGMVGAVVVGELAAPPATTVEPIVATQPAGDQDEASPVVIGAVGGALLATALGAAGWLRRRRLGR